MLVDVRLYARALCVCVCLSVLMAMCVRVGMCVGVDLGVGVGVGGCGRGRGGGEVGGGERGVVSVWVSLRLRGCVAVVSLYRARLIHTSLLPVFES